MTTYTKITWGTYKGKVAFDIVCSDCLPLPETVEAYEGNPREPVTLGDLDPRNGEPWTCCLCGDADESGMVPEDLNAEPYWELI